MQKKSIVDIISFLIILLFLYTGINKIISFKEFEFDLSQSLGWHLGPVIAYLVPAVELIISGCLLVSKTQQIGLLSAFFLMTGFTIYVAYMIIFVSPHNRPCTCGGIIRQMTWPQHLIFNIAYSLLALTGLLLTRNKIEESNKEGTSKISFT